VKCPRASTVFGSTLRRSHGSFSRRRSGPAGPLYFR
jgi:hypothetical protein